ncbi:hypothetical protein Q9233_004293 [Columba guinea]|nr:hypothetical protein Q9233_004293 [Columba guinea]
MIAYGVFLILEEFGRLAMGSAVSQCSQEGGEIRSYECSLVYESKVERKTESKLTGHSMKLIKINTRQNSNRLEKTAFFQNMEKVERTRSFQEETFSESDPEREDEKECCERGQGVFGGAVGQKGVRLEDEQLVASCKLEK